MKKKWNVEKLRSQFFDFKLLSYSNLKEKPKIINFINSNCKKEKKDYINRANEILKNRVDIFGKEHIFKKKINWHYGFYKNYIWKLKKSEEIEIRPKVNSENNIDIKYVWELNRHQFLPYLGFAYYITNDERYSLKFKELITDWIKMNPPLIGVNWISGLEISIRLISWIFALKFFKDSKKINNKKFLGLILRSMFQHSYYLKYFYSKRSFNHTVGDLLGLYLFSKIFKNIGKINKWEKKFYTKFKRQIFLQTRSDGIDIEQSINYHRFVLEFFIIFLIINQDNLKHNEVKRILKMFEFLVYSIKPNGRLPNIGDSDQGFVLPFSDYFNGKLKNLINIGSIIFNRSDFKYISDEIRLISLLFFGLEGYNKFNKISPQKPHQKLFIFNKSGFIILRNNWENTANYIFINFGKFGPQNAPHSHSDITNFIFSFKGKDIIIDSGTYTYNRSWKERNYFRSSKSHNVLTINDKNQAEIFHWFGWKNKPKTKRKVKKLNNSFTISCLHDGYKGFIVQRYIKCFKNLDNLEIKDLIFLRSDNSYKKLRCANLFFHFAEDINIQLENNRIKINNNLSMRIHSNISFHLKLENSYYSPKYGEILSNKRLNVSLKLDQFSEKNIKIITKIEKIS
ncbi:MAG: alginate lyase family protein [Promethearchaeota archaeon]